jgi:hypothetical protein
MEQAGIKHCGCDVFREVLKRVLIRGKLTQGEPEFVLQNLFCRGKGVFYASKSVGKTKKMHSFSLWIWTCNVR